MEIAKTRSYAIFIHDKKTLLGVKTNYNPLFRRGNYWFIGGGAKENEEPEIALKREVAEELGVGILAYRLIGFHASQNNGNCVYYLFYDCVPGSFDFNPRSNPKNDIIDAVWVPVNDVLRYLRGSYIPPYLRQHFRNQTKWRRARLPV